MPRPKAQASPENKTFTSKKRKILAALGVDDDAYTDASPKGSLDAPIRGLIAEINAVEGLVTTSSCSGRVSVFVDGAGAVHEVARVEDGDEGESSRRSGDAQDRESRDGAGGSRVAGGGKGGGRWLFVSHEGDEQSLSRGKSEIAKLLGLGTGSTGAVVRPNVSETANVDDSWSQGERRLVHFKFEPMILHVLTASLDVAQRVLGAAQQAGFRESGVSSVTSETPLVAVRTNGLALESILGLEVKEKLVALVDYAYLGKLWDIAEARFRGNSERINRFQELVRKAFTEDIKGSNGGWEDEEARRIRKRAEGLQRQALALEQKRQRHEKPMVKDVLASTENVDAI